MIKPVNIRINRQKLGEKPRGRVVEGGKMVVSWALDTDHPEAGQQAYRVVVSDRDFNERFDSGWVITASEGCGSTLGQECFLSETGWPRGEKLTARVFVRDMLGREGSAETDFYLGDIEWTAPWISADEDVGEAAVYLRREFDLSREIDHAALFSCGLGYQKITINGTDADESLPKLDPACTDYTRVCQYAVVPDVQDKLQPGKNFINVVLGGGWRRTCINVANYAKPRFFGDKQLTLILKIFYKDGTEEIIDTSEGWKWTLGPITACSVFDGETYDARREIPGWNEPCCGISGMKDAAIVASPCGEMRPMLIPPVRANRFYSPISISEPVKGKWILDFGQNIAGVVTLAIPELPEGTVVTVRHAEFLDEDGTLYTAPLRKAACTDTFISDGKSGYLYPSFTYHGFRYAEITGFKPDLLFTQAIQLYTDLDKETTFRSGSALLNAIHDNVLMTERDNMHSILTDCPQRDERMGWMNDATVRFEETPFNFETGAMFRKIVRDIRAGQREDGAISCTVPYAVFGSFPADPVCSSYLVAAWQNYLHNGDLETIEENFEGFAAWENCLLEHSDDYIVNYSYYGDWAGPAYACEGNDGAKSVVTPGIFMSTGYSYYNCTLLSKFARLLGREERAQEYDALAAKIKQAMLDKWYDPASAKMATGSEACQAFSLWLGIIPEGDRQRAAKLMRDDLIARDYRFTTGNLCTRYMLDMLSEYGYIDDAYALMTREEYPSFGFMIQQEATTVWERFELKKQPGMNSHNHPMYGAADSWLYTSLLGVKITGAGFETLEIAPKIPKKLMSAQGCIDTVRGPVNVRWVKRYGGVHLYIDLPVGVTAKVLFGRQEKVVSAGTHHFEMPQDECR